MFVNQRQGRHVMKKYGRTVAVGDIKGRVFKHVGFCLGHTAPSREALKLINNSLLRHRIFTITPCIYDVMRQRRSINVKDQTSTKMGRICGGQFTIFGHLNAGA